MLAYVYIHSTIIAIKMKNIFITTEVFLSYPSLSPFSGSCRRAIAQVLSVTIDYFAFS